MPIYNDFNEKYHIFKRFFLLFLEVFKLFSLCIKSINSSSISKKKIDGNNFIPTPRKWLRGQNTSVGIRLTELTETFDTWHYKLFVKHCILQTILQVFSLYIFMWSKIFCSKNWAVFYIFLDWFGLAFGVTVLKVMCFWCPFLRLLGIKISLATADINCWE